MNICNLLIINILQGVGKTRYPNLCFPRFLLKNDSILRLTFCRAAFGVQSPKGSPLSLSKWRTEKGKTQRPFDRLRERQRINSQKNQKVQKESKEFKKFKSQKPIAKS